MRGAERRGRDGEEKGGEQNWSEAERAREREAGRTAFHVLCRYFEPCVHMRGEGGQGRGEICLREGAFVQATCLCYLHLALIVQSYSQHRRPVRTL